MTHKFNINDRVTTLEDSSAYEIVEITIFSTGVTYLLTNSQRIREEFLRKEPKYTYLYTFCGSNGWTVSIERYENDNDFSNNNPMYKMFQKIVASRMAE